MFTRNGTAHSTAGGRCIFVVFSSELTRHGAHLDFHSFNPTTHYPEPDDDPGKARTQTLAQAVPVLLLARTG